MTLEELNRLDGAGAEEVFLRCCGSTRWARRMSARRPFRDVLAVVEAAEAAWRTLDADDWLEAFAAHPRIGAPPSGGTNGTVETGGRSGSGGAGLDWSAREQAGMIGADAATRQRLAAANREYESRFGFIYIVCATGKSARELLETAERRLAHSRDEELRVAVEEQMEITRLRVRKLVS